MAQSNHFKQILNTIYMYNIYNNKVLEMCNSNSIVAVLIRRPWTGIFFYLFIILIIIIYL